MQINITYDASVSGAPAGFTAAVDAAVQYFEDNLSAAVTINITIGWGDLAGQPLPVGALGATYASQIALTYDEVRNAFWSDAVTADTMTAAMI